jgi:multisubunit Na+/H+ antiporter MnhB subunit
MTPRRSVIVDTTVRLVFDAALVLSVYLLFAGHNQPGGGFVGGLVAAAAFALRYISGGLEDVHAAAPGPPWGFLSAGLLVAVVAALVPVVAGAGPLDQTAVDWDLLLVGHVKLTTATVFDTGVYLIVVGVVLMAFEGLGEYWRDAVRPPPEDGT